MDAAKQVIDSSNKTSVTFSSDRVGNYRFSLQVKEAYGQSTYQEFIQDEHYLRDASERVDEMGEVEVYKQDDKFNIPEKDKLVTIDNAPPTIDFAMFSKSKVDIVLNFAGLDVSNQKHDRTSYGNNIRTYRGVYVETREHHKDHYYFDYDTDKKNKLTSQAGDLQADLIAKGIDARIIIDNFYAKTADNDGVGERNIPVWGTTEWYTTQSCGSQSTTNASWSPSNGCYISSTSTTSQSNTVIGDINYSPAAPWQLTGSVYRQFTSSETNTTGCSQPSGYYVSSSSSSTDPKQKSQRLVALMKGTTGNIPLHS